MSHIIEEITELTDEWRSLAGKDHCKDHDFHWYVETKWSYGFPPKYIVCHYGYILHTIEEECDSYELALVRLKEILTEEIKNYRLHQKNEDEDIGW